MRFLLAIAATLITLVLLLLQWLTYVLLVILILVSLAALYLMLRYFYKKIYLRVPEHTVYVIHNVRRNEFARLLWHKGNRQLVLPVLECVSHKFNTRPKMANGAAKEVHTQDRIPLRIEYRIVFQLNPKGVDRQLLSSILELIVKFPENMMRNNAEDCLREVVGEYSAAFLTSGENHQQLSREVRDAVQARVRGLGMSVFRVMIGAITPPESYQKQINVAEQRKIEAQAETAVLTQQAEALKVLADNSNLQKLWVWLEQLRMMDKNGTFVPTIMPYVTQLDWNGGSDNLTPSNGRTPPRSGLGKNNRRPPIDWGHH